jgi:sugar/nucleoside kinase (ribokinase family)
VLLGNIDPAQLLEVLDQLDAPRLVVADTMNLWIDIRMADLRDLLRRTHLLVINDEEARQLSGEDNLVRAARELIRMGPSTVIIKKGEHGALVFSGESVAALPAWPLEAVADPTGAGDSFAGALIGYLAKREQVSDSALRTAAAYGTVVASYCVEGVGIERLAAISTSDITDRFQKFQALTRISE